MILRTLATEGEGRVDIKGDNIVKDRDSQRSESEHQNEDLIISRDSKTAQNRQPQFCLATSTFDETGREDDLSYTEPSSVHTDVILITGGMPGIVHKRFIDCGGSSEVYEVYDTALLFAHCVRWKIKQMER